ncbi:MAG: hypothetical protein L0H71_12190, partial [Yaniella sp.]|nr:hypothetical protein [Yaniella sp.]
TCGPTHHVSDPSDALPNQVTQEKPELEKSPSELAFPQKPVRSAEIAFHNIRRPLKVLTQ